MNSFKLLTGLMSVGQFFKCFYYLHCYGTVFAFEMASFYAYNNLYNAIAF